MIQGYLLDTLNMVIGCVENFQSVNIQSYYNPPEYFDNIWIISDPCEPCEPCAALLICPLSSFERGASRLFCFRTVISYCNECNLSHLPLNPKANDDYTTHSNKQKQQNQPKWCLGGMTEEMIFGALWGHLHDYGCDFGSSLATN